MRYVGIDPSTVTGLVIIENNQVVVETEIKSKIKTDPRRFMDIAYNIVTQLKKGDVVAIEGFSFGSKGQGVSVQYGIGWIIRQELIRNGYKYIEVPPTSLKKFATGKGNTKKEDMVLPVFRKWGYECKTNNIRDAYILAKIAETITTKRELLEYEKEALSKLIG